MLGPMTRTTVFNYVRRLAFGYHRHAENRATCMLFATGATGTTGAAILKLIIHKRPRCSILENSKVLGDQNLKYLIALLTAHNFDVFAFTADAAEFGSPSRRDRQYVVVVPSNDRPGAWTIEFENLLFNMRVGAGNPYDYLLQPEHPRYLKWLEWMVEHRAALSDAKKPQQAKRRKALSFRRRGFVNRALTHVTWLASVVGIALRLPASGVSHITTL